MQEFWQLTERIIEDMGEAKLYWKAAAAASLLAALLAVLICLIPAAKTGNGRRKRRVPVFLTALSVFYVVEAEGFVFWGREDGSRREVQLELFASLGTLTENAYFIENIILFIPFGFLWAWIARYYEKKGTCGICVLTAFLLSIAIESLQYIYAHGFTQADDVLTNTCGAFLGYALAALVFGTVDFFIGRKH